jgi:hypothetical protein
LLIWALAHDIADKLSKPVRHLISLSQAIEENDGFQSPVGIQQQYIVEAITREVAQLAANRELPEGERCSA